VSIKSMGLLAIGTQYSCLKVGEWPSSGINCVAGYFLSYLFSNTHN